MNALQFTSARQIDPSMGRNNRIGSPHPGTKPSVTVAEAFVQQKNCRELQPLVWQQKDTFFFRKNFAKLRFAHVSGSLSSRSHWPGKDLELSALE